MVFIFSLEICILLSLIHFQVCIFSGSFKYPYNTIVVFVLLAVLYFEGR